VGLILGEPIIVPIITLTFFLGMAFLLLGAVTTVTEITKSYDAISKEVKFTKNQRKI